MKVSQAAIDAGVVAGRTALRNYSTFASMEVSDDALNTFVVDVLRAGFGTVVTPNTTTGPAAHPHPNTNPPIPADDPPKPLLAAEASHEDADEGDEDDNDDE